jgi:hypothetical protein
VHYGKYESFFLSNSSTLPSVADYIIESKGKYKVHPRTDYEGPELE